MEDRDKIHDILLEQEYQEQGEVKLTKEEFEAFKGLDDSYRKFKPKVNMYDETDHEH